MIAKRFKNFYQKLSEEMNYVSEEQAQLFYLGLCRFIIKELNAGRKVLLPYLGFFDVKPCKPKRSMPVMGQKYHVATNLQPTVRVFFYVNQILRQAFKQRFTGHSSYRYKFGPKSYY